MAAADQLSSSFVRNFVRTIRYLISLNFGKTTFWFESSIGVSKDHPCAQKGERGASKNGVVGTRDVNGRQL
jgi:hypothetical protein